MLTVLNVFGTRPEAIKMAPVIMELGKHSNRVRSVICSVAQHREMLDQVLSIFEIEPDYDLNLMQPDQSLSQLTANLFAGLEPVVCEVKPDWILAQGDTTTVFVAAMVAFYHGIAFGHVEAGLRTGDRARPFPEEINRRLADAVATAYFAPTENARQALLREGCSERDIYVTGNTVVDALNEVANRHVQRRDRLEVMRLRRKPRHVPAKPRTGILKAPVVILQMIELVEITGVLAEARTQKRRSHLFGGRVHTHVFAAGAREQPHVRHAWGGDAHLAEEQHR